MAGTVALRRERPGGILMSAAMTDAGARVPSRDARVDAVVGEGNYRRIALCRGHGLCEELSRPGPGWRWLAAPPGFR